MGQKKGNRTKPFIDEIEKEIITKICEGYSATLLIDYLMKHWDFKTESNCRRYIDNAQKKIMTSNSLEDINFKIDKYKEMYLNLYNQAYGAAEWKTANAVLDSLVKIEGLNKTIIDSKITAEITGDLSNITDQKLDEIVNKLLIRDKQINVED